VADVNEAAHPRKSGNAYNNPTQYPTGGGSGWFDDVAAKLYQPPVKTTMDLPNALLHRAWGQAACKLEGFTYAPSDTVYWQHGHSTEHDFIYVTTQHLNAGQLAQLSDEVGPERTLLVLCAAFRVSKSGTERYPNLTVKKIPKAVLAGCE